MAKLNEKQKIWTVAGVGLGVCLIAGGGVYWAKGLIEDERKAIEAHKNEIAAAEQKIAKIVPTERDVIILRENLDDYVKILPNGRDLNAFVKVLNGFGQLSGIHATNITTPKGARANKNERFSRIEYQYDMTATLWQFMRFMNSIENYERFISITNFTITSGAKATNREADQHDGDYVHEIKLTMETYTYNGSGSGQDVEIPNYADKRNDLREAIFKSIQRIRYDKYDHKGSLGRRDMFVDPRTESGPATGVPLSEQKGLVDQAAADLKKLTELMQRYLSKDRDAPTIFERYNLEKALRDGIGVMQSRIDEVNAKNLVTNPTARRQWQQKVIEPLANLRKEFDGKGGTGTDQYLSQTDMEQLLVEMKRDLEAGNLEDARGRFESVQAKLAVPSTDKRHELVVQAMALHLKTVTAIEFTKLDLKIQGVLVNHDGRSGVLLNGEVYEEGEYVRDDLLVKQVREEQVQFVYRGLTLVRTL
ncbi:MAG TPA: type 4a pilus biogenesis protein PilO [Planctomycetota bacterium]|nr:type 4a pilus biogenesis protein PilO [Planctomycetota bacterium]